MLWDKPWRARTLSSISAMLSQLAWMAGVMDLSSISQRMRLGGRKHFVGRGRRVRIEIGHHYDHLRGIGILLFENLLHREGPILVGPMLRHGSRHRLPASCS